MMNNRKRGLFGRNASPHMAKNSMGSPAMPEQKKPGLGTRLLGEGWQDKLIALGSALQGNSQAIPQYMYNQQAMEAQAAQQAERQRQQMELMDYQAGLGRAQFDYEQANRAPDIGVFEDNAGNRFRYDKRTGLPIDERPVFTDPTERTYFTDGAMVTIPNPYVGGASSSTPSAPVGRLTPIEPNIGNTPAPQLGANGLPATLTRDQYEATVQAMGRAETDAWMRRNNVKVTN